LTSGASLSVRPLAPIGATTWLRPGSYRFVVPVFSGEQAWIVRAAFDVEAGLSDEKSRQVLRLLSDPVTRTCRPADGATDLAQVSEWFSQLSRDEDVLRLLDVPATTFDDAYALAAPVVRIDGLAASALTAQTIRTGDAWLGLGVAIYREGTCMFDRTPCETEATRLSPKSVVARVRERAGQITDDTMKAYLRELATELETGSKPEGRLADDVGQAFPEPRLGMNGAADICSARWDAIYSILRSAGPPTTQAMHAHPSEVVAARARADGAAVSE